MEKIGDVYETGLTAGLGFGVTKETGCIMEEFVLRPKEVIFMKNEKIRKAATGLHLRIDFENHKMAEAFYKKIREVDWRTQLETGEDVVLKLEPVTKSYVEIKGNGKTAKMMIKEVFEDIYE